MGLGDPAVRLQYDEALCPQALGRISTWARIRSEVSASNFQMLDQGRTQGRDVVRVRVPDEFRTELCIESSGDLLVLRHQQATAWPRKRLVGPRGDDQSGMLVEGEERAGGPTQSCRESASRRR